MSMEDGAISGMPGVGATVVFAGRRDGFQVPIALAEGGLLESLVTDLYVGPGLHQVLKGIGLSRKVDPYAPGHGLHERVHVSLAALAANLVRFPAAREMLNRYKDRVLSQRAGQVALERSSNVFAYSYYAAEAFRAVLPTGRSRVLFQVHPHPATVRRVLRERIEAEPRTASSLGRELELKLPPEAFARLDEEARLATGIICASSFTAASLREAGIPPERVSIVPYGVSAAWIAEADLAQKSPSRLRVAFVGAMCERKGLSILFRAMRALGPGRATLVLCSRGWKDEEILAQAGDLDIELVWNEPDHEVRTRLASCDVFCLPSIAEGFGLVILESMGLGLPVITTVATAGPDVLVDGESGFVIPAGDTLALAEKLEWCLGHRAELARMGRVAWAEAKARPWSRFREELRAAYRKACAPVDRPPGEMSPRDAGREP